VPADRLLACIAGLFLVGALLIHLGHRLRRVEAGARARDWLKYAVYVGVINSLWAAAYLGRPAAGALLLAIVVAGAVEIYRIAPASHRGSAAVLATLLFVLALGHLLAPSLAWQARFVFVVIVTATTDSFAQLCGRLLGRRRLCPRLSPEKTIGGLWCGLGMAVAVSLLLGFLIPEARGWRLALLGFATALGAVGGDLLFSAIKRRVGVKDFSALLPGHGGALDRFDSLLLASPVFYWTRAAVLGP
jgi:phosphatidate cytidylyltransferase